MEDGDSATRPPATRGTRARVDLVIDLVGPWMHSPFWTLYMFGSADNRLLPSRYLGTWLQSDNDAGENSVHVSDPTSDLNICTVLSHGSVILRLS